MGTSNNPGWREQQIDIILREQEVQRQRQAMAKTWSEFAQIAKFLWKALAFGLSVILILVKNKKDQ